MSLTALSDVVLHYHRQAGNACNGAAIGDHRNPAGELHFRIQLAPIVAHLEPVVDVAVAAGVGLLR